MNARVCLISLTNLVSFITWGVPYDHSKLMFHFADSHNRSESILLCNTYKASFGYLAVVDAFEGTFLGEDHAPSSCRYMKCPFSTTPGTVAHPVREPFG